MEKRKKLSVQVEDGPYHVDVQEYENKKSTFRHRWVYFVALAVILIIAYFQLGGSTSSKSQHKKPVGFTEPSQPRNNNNSAKQLPQQLLAVADPALQVNKSDRLETKTADGAAPVLAKKTEEESPSLRGNAQADSAPDEDEVSEADLQAMVDAQIALVRKMKTEQHLVMEKDPQARKETAKLQDLTRNLIYKQYGRDPLRVELKLLFPQSMSQPTMPQEQSLIVDLAPVSLVPYSVYYFLQMVKHWKTGAFHRNAGHVLQAMVNLDLPPGQRNQGMAFQEYHPDFPHKQYTLGYAGRPGGPAFYISTVNNVHNHGPGSQGSSTEADGCFGKLQSQSIDVVKRMQTQPGASKPVGFINNAANHIKIISARVLK